VSIWKLDYQIGVPITKKETSMVEIISKNIGEDEVYN